MPPLRWNSPSAKKTWGAASACVAFWATMIQAACGPVASTEAVLPTPPTSDIDASMGDSSGAAGSGASGSSGGGSGGTGAGSDASDEDAASGSSSGDDGSIASSPGDATSEGGPASSNDALAAVGPPGCPNPLGSVWSVTESANTCRSTWTRQGSTANFTDKEASPCNVMATITVTISGTDVSAYWTSSTDNDDCNYLGTMNADCSSASGLYTCSSGNAASGMWNATIQ